ncbi:MAG TPA: amidohydrolase, partial [Thermoanaerobaculia bacterium]
PASEGVARASGARHIELSGLTLLPGLIDAHAHVAGLGVSLETVQLAGTTSYDEVLARIAERTGSIPKGEWITGRGWDQNDWPVMDFPTAAALDRAVPDHPVFVNRVDGHAALANSAAMRAARVTAQTPDPDGGRILRDASGNPTGVFIDNAKSLIEAVIPPPSRETRKRRLALAANDIAANGLTSVHDAGADGFTIALVQELIDEGKWPIRTYLMLTDNGVLHELWFRSGPLINYKDRLTVRSVKLYADGALGSRGAALLAPYSDDPQNHGLLVSRPEHILDVTRRAKAAGFQVNTHAIGDRGVRVAIDAYEKAGMTAADRARIEHLQVIALEDLPRLAKSGILSSMQPTHATSDMYWAEARLGTERVRGAYAWRKVLNAGGRLVSGSDFPVEDVNPFFGIYAAVTRQDQKAWPAGGWYPEERLTIAEAIRGFTSDAAFAAFQEADSGTIEPGKWADFTVVEQNPYEIPPADLYRVRVRYTIVAGEIVYRSE